MGHRGSAVSLWCSFCAAKFREDLASQLQTFAARPNSQIKRNCAEATI